VPFLKPLGLLPGFTAAAIGALDRTDAPAAALLWLDRRQRQEELRPLTDALMTGGDEAARNRLLDLPVSPMGSTTGRRLAQSVRLPDLLRRTPDDPETLASERAAAGPDDEPA
jgi:hypothetical protein